MSGITMKQILKMKSLRELDVGTHISLKHDYIYFQVSKSGSSTLKYYLQKEEVRGTGRKVLDVNDRYKSPHVCPTQLKETDFINLLENLSIAKFSFVRNPFSRLLSCYMHRIVAEPHSASNRVLMRLTGGRGGADVSFQEFIEIICDQESRDQESHWRVQHDEILYDLVGNWTFIGKLENLEADLDKLLAYLGKKRRSGKGSTSNLSPMTTGASDRVRKFYDDRLVRLVVERYRKDFEAFGYSESID